MAISLNKEKTVFWKKIFDLHCAIDNTIGITDAMCYFTIDECKRGEDCHYLHNKNNIKPCIYKYRQCCPIQLDEKLNPIECNYMHDNDTNIRYSLMVAFDESHSILVPNYY